MRRKNLLYGVLLMMAFGIMLMPACNPDEESPQNTAPEVSNPLADVEVDEGFGTRQVPLGNVFTDADGDALSYTVSSSNTSVATVSVSNGMLSITEAGTGNANIIVIADDGNEGTAEDAFALTVNEVNEAPAVATPLEDVSADEGFGTRIIDVSGTFTDPDGDALTLTVTSSVETVATVAFGQNPNNLIITEVGVGATTITITAADPDQLTVTDEFTFTVNSTNAAPVVANAIADAEFEEGFGSSTVDISSTFSDADGDALVYDASSSDETVVTVSVDNTTLTITEVGMGTATITVNAYDPSQASGSTTFAVNVSAPANNAPTLANAIADDSQEEGFGSKTLDLTDVFSDADGDNLSYTASSSDETVATASIIEGYFVFITEVGPGTTTITVVAEDGNGGSISDAFDLTITEAPNNAPVVDAAITDQSQNEGFGSTTIDLSTVFTDADGDALSYSASSGNTAVVTVSVNGNTLTVTEAGNGTAEITVTADDGNGGTVSDIFAFTVNNVNEAPAVTNPIADKTVTEGFGTEDIALDAVFADPDGDALDLFANSSNTAVVTAAVSGTTLTLTEVGPGTATITVAAYDPMQVGVEDQFVVTVEAAGTSVDIGFGGTDGNSITVSDWTDIAADGYVIVMSDANSFSDRVDGESPAGSTTYKGTGEQVVYHGTMVSSFTVTMLGQSSTYFFKVFPYSGSNVYDNSQSSASTSTTSCSTTSTTESQICYTLTASTRTIDSNQLPGHATGNFPNADVTAIEINRTLPMVPTDATSPIYVYSEVSRPSPSNQTWYNFGTSSNGLGFNPMGVEAWTNPDTGEENWEWQTRVAFQGDKSQDQYGGHVTSAGKYHYHGTTTALAADEDGSRHSLIYGWAADGYPIYYKYSYVDPLDASSGLKELQSSYQLRSGTRPGDGTSAPDGSYDGTYVQDYEYISGLGDLDECNGRYGVTPEFPEGTYYYVISVDFSVIPNCFMGQPDDSYLIGNN